MKEKPMIFTGESVRAILEGRKTQTRRVIKWTITSKSDGAKKRIFNESDVDEMNRLLQTRQTHPLNIFASYQVGDQVWVRETFYCDHPEMTREHLDSIYYRADGDCCGQIPECQCWDVGKPRWKSPIYMPRWASRITLEVVQVRAERLQDITEADAKAEGFNSVADYAEAWDNLNGKKTPWSSNPWVWAIKFKKLEAK